MATTARTSLSGGRLVDKVSSEFMASELDGFGLKASDARQVREGGGVWLLGKRGDVPAALRLTHAAKEEVDLVMVASKLGVGASLADGTRAATHNGFNLSSHLVPFLIGSKYIRRRNLFFYDPL